MNRRILLLAILPVAGGCLHGRSAEFNRYFESGLYREAVEAAARNPEAVASQDGLYRLALSHLVAGTSVYDPLRAEGILNDLLARDPSGSRGVEARILASQLAATRRATRDLHLARHGADSLASELVSLRAEWGGLESQAAETDQEMERLRARARSLETELRGREEEVAVLQRTLDELKRIDLRRSGSSTVPFGGINDPRER